MVTNVLQTHMTKQKLSILKKINNLGMVFMLLLFVLGCEAEKQDTATYDLIEIQGHIVELLTSDPTEDAEVCWKQMCSSTDDSGMYTLSIPVGEQFLTVQKDEHYGGIIPIVVEDQIQEQIQEQVQKIPNVSLITTDLFAAQLSTVNLEADVSTGSIAFSISNGIFGDGINIEGVRVSIEPDVGEGPFYTTSIGLPSSDLQETSEHGGGVVTHLPEETYTLFSEPLPNNCSPLLGWGESATLRIPVVSNFVSFARIECIADE